MHSEDVRIIATDTNLSYSISFVPHCIASSEEDGKSTKEIEQDT